MYKCCFGIFAKKVTFSRRISLVCLNMTYCVLFHTFNFILGINWHIYTVSSRHSSLRVHSLFEWPASGSKRKGRQLYSFIEDFIFFILYSKCQHSKYIHTNSPNLFTSAVRTYCGTQVVCSQLCYRGKRQARPTSLTCQHLFLQDVLGSGLKCYCDLWKYIFF